jgi:hypothetical protein
MVAARRCPNGRSSCAVASAGIGCWLNAGRIGLQYGQRFFGLLLVILGAQGHKDAEGFLERRLGALIAVKSLFAFSLIGRLVQPAQLQQR